MPNQTETAIFSIKDEGGGMCTLAIGDETYVCDYSHAIRVLGQMLSKVEKWEERETS